MRNAKKDFTLLERLMVVAIIVFVAAIAIQNVLLSVKSSEEQTVNAAKVEYAAVRSMYAGQSRTPSSNLAIH